MEHGIDYIVMTIILKGGNGVGMSNPSPHPFSILKSIPAPPPSPFKSPVLICGLLENAKLFQIIPAHTKKKKSIYFFETDSETSHSNQTHSMLEDMNMFQSSL